MATRSIISVVATEGYATETGSSINIRDQRISWFGRYCHWDGYPEHMVPAICGVVQKHGLPLAKTLIMRSSYSSFGFGSDSNDPDAIGTVTYPNDGYILDGGDDWGTEYRYLIKDNGELEVYSVGTIHHLLDTYSLFTGKKITRTAGAPLSLVK